MNKIKETDNRYLNEQQRVLNCLYRVDELLSNPETEEERVFEQLLDIIPTGWRFSDICRVSIALNDRIFRSPDFKNTELKLVSKIVVDDEVLGEITVCYIKPLRIEKGIFLPDEVMLVKTLGAKISNFLLLKKLRQTIKTIKNGSAETETSHGSTKPLREWLKQLELTDEEVNSFTKVQLRFRKGETMCKQGSITSYVMLLADGLTKNYLEGYQERGFNFSIVKPFDFIGLSGLYGSSLYHFSCAALTPCTVYVIENTLFKQTAESNRNFSKHLFGWYCRTTERHLRRLSCIANKQALGRIAEILLYLKNDVFQSPVIKPIISRKDIAELAAMSTESAVRILSDLKKDNIINITGNEIEIIDEKLLQTLSYSG